MNARAALLSRCRSQGVCVATVESESTRVANCEPFCGRVDVLRVEQRTRLRSGRLHPPHRVHSRYRVGRCRAGVSEPTLLSAQRRARYDGWQGSVGWRSQRELTPRGAGAVADILKKAQPSTSSGSGSTGARRRASGSARCARSSSPSRAHRQRSVGASRTRVGGDKRGERAQRHVDSGFTCVRART